MSEPFRLLLRVRYGECDAQGIVFNARWAEYVDIATCEFTRVLFGGIDPKKTGLDWMLAKQTIEWYAPGRFDDVIDIRVRTVRIGTTSFVLASDLRRCADQVHLVSVETVYVMIDPATGVKTVIPDTARAALDCGAPGVVVDHAAALALLDR